MSFTDVLQSPPDNFWLLVVVGFVAQLIDGSLGMAYGVSCSSMLLSLGAMPMRVASAAIHTAEIFTTLASGLSHWRQNNIDKQVFTRLLVPGIMGASLGAVILSVADVSWLVPAVCVYLIIMGGRIIYRALVTSQSKIEQRWIGFIGFIGGLLDAIGGGGWGPVVTTSLVAQGKNVRMAIGSVNSAEFFVTVAQVVTFSGFVSLSGCFWPILALIVGGVAAAPLGAIVCKHMPAKPMMIAVGLLVIGLNVFTLRRLFWGGL